MKFGSVVTVWTNFLNGTDFISFRKTAKIIGNHEKTLLAHQLTHGEYIASVQRI